MTPFDVGKARQEALEASWALRGDMTAHRAPALALTLILTCHGCGGPVEVLASGRDTGQRAARTLRCVGRCTSKPGVVQIQYLYGNV